jgi:hypothetical protein
MRRIIELGDGPKIYARYNTNLSRVEYKGINLFSDILDHVRDYQICASLDGTDAIGEYIRTGLNYTQWLENYHQACEHRRYSRQCRIDFTLTLPGMVDIENIVKLAQDTDSEILAKVIFSFTPDIIMSPLALPRNILDLWIDELLPTVNGALKDVLLQLKQRPTFEEQWPETYRAGLKRGKQRVLMLEQIRTQSITIQEILSARPKILEWWNQIES